jgi:dihydrolipoamide dehydrogenase
LAEFDLAIIGAGPGGYVAAARAAELGMKVACIDKRALGGTCLNVGCIPSKALLESSELYYRTQKGLEHHGIKAQGIELDLAAMMARKDKIVQTMAKGIDSLFKGHKVSYFAATARLVAPGRIELTGADQKELTARHILLATGSAPIELPGLPFDGERVIDSTAALSLPEVPERLAVVGGGVIGLEMGSVWSRLGAAVTVVEFTDGILPGMDGEIAGQLLRLLKRQGFSFALGTGAKEAVVAGEKVELRLESGGEERVESFDRVLVAVGRRPYLQGLWADGLNIEVEGGRIVVGDDYQTGVEGVYAVGDLVAGPMLAHKAEAEAVAAVERMAGKAGMVNYNAIPNVVYTHPEVASVGLSEEEARAAGHQVRVGKHLFRANARAHCMDEIDGLVKVVVAEDDRLLGMHILGPQASHLIAEGVTAMEFGASAEDVARTVHAHPALSEVVKEAAWDAFA